MSAIGSAEHTALMTRAETIGAAARLERLKVVHFFFSAAG